MNEPPAFAIRNLEAIGETFTAIIWRGGGLLTSRDGQSRHHLPVHGLIMGVASHQNVSVLVGSGIYTLGCPREVLGGAERVGRIGIGSR